MRRVVVTGLGALTPIGLDVASYWESLVTGRSGAGPITYFDPSLFKTQFACELTGFDPKAYLDHKEARIYDPFTQYGLVAVEEALSDSGLSVSGFESTRAGVIWGSGNGGFRSFEEGMIAHAQGDMNPRFNPYFIPKLLVNMAGGVIALKFGFKGITFTPVSACASGNSAIIEAYHHIQWGHADIMVAGASDAAITQAGIGGFNASKALSQQNDHPETASRPFDSHRDGFVMGEGAGALILESLEHALARGAKIYAEVGGGAMTSDAYHLTASHPEGEGAQRAMRLTLQMAGLDADQVDYINAHATSTPLGDLSEAVAISKVFPDRSPIISSTKSMTGHLLGAAAAIEAVATVKTIHTNRIPATTNTQELDPDIPKHLHILTGSSIEHQVSVAMSNAFGFGGHNASVLFKKYQS